MLVLGRDYGQLWVVCNVVEPCLGYRACGFVGIRRLDDGAQVGCGRDVNLVSVDDYRVRGLYIYVVEGVGPGLFVGTCSLL